ncbi:MAG: hypothetical protein ABSH06_00385 [Thermodesulfobacteriota bacterium]
MSIAILSSLVLTKRNPYTIYEVRREKGEVFEQLTVTFEWYGESNPDLLNFNQIFHEAQKFKSKNTGEKVDLREKQKKGSFFIDPLGTPLFGDPLGLLTREEKRNDLERLRKAGFTDEEIANYLGQTLGFDVDAARKAGKTSTEIVEYLSAHERPTDKTGRWKLPTYTILKKTVNPIKWNSSFQ